MQIHALIVSTPDDLHSQVVRQEVERLGGGATIIDSAEFPEKLSIEYSNGRKSFLKIRSSEDKEWLIHRDCGIWWRRPRGHDLSGVLGHPKLKSFAADEARQAFLGSLSAHCHRFVNPLGASRQASVKLYHLELARNFGFHVPRTLVTNSPNTAAEFVREQLSGCVYKPFTGTDFGFFETRSFASDQDVTELWRIQHCPMLIQEHIQGLADVRVTVVGDQVFAASFDLTKSRHGIDSRVERLPAARYEIGDRVNSQILRFVRELGLHYGALDFRLSDSGKLVFFEINPEGQYLWVEIDTGQEISRAMAELLVGDQLVADSQRAFSSVRLQSSQCAEQSVAGDAPKAARS